MSLKGTQKLRRKLMELHPHIKGVELLFETPDLALAAYLRIMGLKIRKIYSRGNKAIFSFIDISERKVWIDDYFNGKAKVDPLVYKDTLRNLKTYTYNRR